MSYSVEHMDLLAIIDNRQVGYDVVLFGFARVDVVVWQSGTHRSYYLAAEFSDGGLFVYKAQVVYHYILC